MKKLAGLAIAALALPTSALAQSDDQFDLVCQGQMIVRGHAQPWNPHFHIDLKRKKYCNSDCGKVSGIHKVKDNEIQLEDYPVRDRYYTLRVNRLSGALRYFNQEADETGDAQCEARPFTGMEPSKRKF